MVIFKNVEISSKLNKILKFGSCLLVLILPIFYLSDVSFSFTSPKTYLFYGFVEVLTAVWVYALYMDPSFRLSKRTWLYFIPLFSYVLWMTLAGALAVNPHKSFWSTLGRGTGLLTLYHALAFALIVSSLIKKNGEEYLYRLMRWFINGGFILAISVWFGNEGFNAFNFLKGSAGGGLMGNSSLTSTYLIFILAFGIYILTSKPPSKKGQWWLIAKLAVILFSPLFINIYGTLSGKGILGSARGATVGIFVGVISALLGYLIISKKKIFKIIGITGIVLSVIIFSIGWSQLVRPGTYAHEKFTELAGGTRFLLWDASQKSLSEHPYFGYGPENFSIAFQAHFNPKILLREYGNEGWSDRAHNVYYDTGVSGGYGAILLYGLFFMSLFYVLYHLRKSEVVNHKQIAILGGLIVGYIFQGLLIFDSLLSIMALFAVAGIIFASHEKENIENYELKPLNLVMNNTVIVLLCITCSISLIALTFKPAIKDFKFYKITNMPVDLRPARYGDLLKGSKVGNDWDVGLIAITLHRSYTSDPMKIKNDSNFLPYAINDIKAFLQYAEVVAKDNKSDARLHIGIVYLYNVLNFFTDNPYNEAMGNHMIGLLEEAKIYAPTNQEIYYCAAQVYSWKRDYKAVEEEYNKAIALDPSIPNSHILLIKFAKIIGNEKLYNEALSQAENDIPGFKI
jgi:O-antigen ligase